MLAGIGFDALNMLFSQALNHITENKDEASNSTLVLGLAFAVLALLMRLGVTAAYAGLAVMLLRGWGLI